MSLGAWHHRNLLASFLTSFGQFLPKITSNKDGEEHWRSTKFEIKLDGNWTESIFATQILLMDLQYFMYIAWAFRCFSSVAWVSSTSLSSTSCLALSGSGATGWSSAVSSFLAFLLGGVVARGFNRIKRLGAPLGVASFLLLSAASVFSFSLAALLGHLFLVGALLTLVGLLNFCNRFNLSFFALAKCCLVLSAAVVGFFADLISIFTLAVLPLGVLLEGNTVCTGLDWLVSGVFSVEPIEVVDGVFGDNLSTVFSRLSLTAFFSTDPSDSVDEPIAKVFWESARSKESLRRTLHGVGTTAFPGPGQEHNPDFAGGPRAEWLN